MIKIYYNEDGLLDSTETSSLFIEVNEVPFIDNNKGEFYRVVDNKLTIDTNDNIKIKYYQTLLSSTDYKFMDDYDKKDTPEWLALKEERAKARLFLREQGY